MKNYALSSYLRFSFVSSCNTKAADEKKSGKNSCRRWHCEEKAINIIDTIDYNKRMLALSNNDTTEGGR
jgi:hypothetical protein